MSTSRTPDPAEKPVEPFIPGPQIARERGLTVDQLYKASDRGEFARYYVFGKRRYYLRSEVEAAIKNLVPGDPVKFHQLVASLDAAAPVRARRPRRPMRPEGGGR